MAGVRKLTGAASRHTYNPALHFDVLIGGYDIGFFLNRTLSFTLEDHAKRYDQFRWRLDNRDGALTDLKHIALGLLLRVRIGYADDTQGWRTFIVSRMSGGVGVRQKDGDEMAAVGDNESVIEYSGRNRNAPNLRGKRRKAKRPSSPYRGSTGPTGRGGPLHAKKFQGGATSDVSQYDNMQRSAWYGPLEGGNTRIFNVRHLSDAAREIARRQGYPDEKIFVEDTNDEVDSVVIPVGMTDAMFLRTQAQDRLGWRFDCQGDEFHFHSARWSKANSKPKTVYNYGGPDIIRLNVDFDFRLPIPGTVKTKGYDFMKRAQVYSAEDAATSPVQDKIASFFFDTRGSSYGQSQRKRHLYMDPVYSIPGGSKGLAPEKAQQSFLNKHVRAMKISLTVVGDPDIQGGDTIGITGTGSPLVDGYWYVEMARHVFSGTTYVTEFDLRPPAKEKRRLGSLVVLRGEVHDVDATTKGLSGYGQYFIRGRSAVLRRLEARAKGSADLGK